MCWEKREYMEMQKNQGKKAIHPNIFLLGIISFFNDISSEMIAPLLPYLILQLGGTGFAIGLIGGLRKSVVEVLKVLFGYFSDKLGKRKIFIYPSYALTSSLKLLLVFVQTWVHVLFVITLERACKSIRSAPRDSLITQSIPKYLGKGFAIHKAIDAFGGIIGSIAVFVLLWQWGLRINTIVFIASGIAFLSLVPLYFVQEKKRANRDGTKISLGNLSRSLRVFIFVASIFSCANISYMFFILRAREAFAHIHPVLVPMLLFVFFNVFYTFSAVPLGILSDIIGRHKIITIGYGLFGLTLFGFAYAATLVSFAFLFILYGVSLAIIEVNHKAYVSDLSSKDIRATALGVFYTFTGISMFLGSVLIGVLWERIAHSYIFVCTGVIALCASLLLVCLRKPLCRNLR